jgi:hypothetical protein
MPPFFILDSDQPLVRDESPKEQQKRPMNEDEDDEPIVVSMCGSERHVDLPRTISSIGDVGRLPRKRVTFNLGGGVRVVQSLKRLASQYKAAIWMTEDDYERTQKEAKEEFHRLKNDSLASSGASSFSTGIESVHRYQQRRDTQVAATQAVLTEQTTQQRDGYICEELIAMVYEEYSDASRTRAYLAGVMMGIESQH